MYLPEPEFLINILKKMSIGNEDHVILYQKNNSDFYSMTETTEIYFTFKFLGHKKISILNGGYPYFKKNLIYLLKK